MATELTGLFGLGRIQQRLDDVVGRAPAVLQHVEADVTVRVQEAHRVGLVRVLLVKKEE